MNTFLRLVIGRRRLLVATLTGVASLGLAACGRSGSRGSAGSSGSASSGSQGWPRTVKTDDGDLALSSKPQRIVSTSVALTGSLLAVGAPVVASAVTAPNTDGLSDDSGFFVQWSDAAKKQKVEKLYEIKSVDITKVAGYEPDLIVVAKSGGDSVADQVEQLRDIAPVMVVDYTGRSWQDVTRTIGQATGNEQQADTVIADYDAHVSATKEAIAVPKGTTSAFIVYGGGGGGAAALTAESPQVQVLTSLGFTMADIPEEVKGDTSKGQRQDIVKLSNENVQTGLPGDNWVIVAADSASRQKVADDPTFSTATQVTHGRVAYTPASTFRLDYYSAIIMLDSLKESYKKG